MTLIDSLNRVPDFRRKQGQRFSLTSVLVIITMAIMSGRFGFREIATFAKANKDDFVKYLKIKKNMVPSHVTIRKIIMNIDFDSLNLHFSQWALGYVSIEKDEWLSLDGKAIRSTINDHDNAFQNFVSLVSVFSQKRGQVIKTGMYENKKVSEISVVENLIMALDLKDVVLTLDALHCKKTLDLIIKSNNHYLVKVKGNQPNLQKALQKIVDSTECISEYQTVENTRGRREKRIVTIFKPTSDIPKEWPALHRIIQVERKFTKKGSEHHYFSLYISSYPRDDAKVLAIGIRGHWYIENKLHWVKDVILKEDTTKHRSGAAAQNMSILRNIAMNIYNKNNYSSIKHATLFFASNVKELMLLIFRS